MNLLGKKVSKNLLSTDTDLFICGVYVPPEKSSYFDEHVFEELENDITYFNSKGNTMILGDFNARTNTLADFVPKDGNQFINDVSETSLHPKIRQNFDTTINNHGKHLINICKNTDLRILNGRTKGDSLGRPTFHGKNGISSIDYIICDQETFQNVNHFIVKQPTYLSDHSQLIAWIDIYQPTLNTSNVGEQTPLHKLPLKFEWSNNATDIFRQKLKSTEIQEKLNNFTQSTFSNDQDGINECMMQFQDIFIDASKKSLNSNGRNLEGK